MQQRHAETLDQPAQGTASRVRGIALIMIAAALSLGSLALLIVLLAPGLSAVNAGTRADGTESFQIVTAPDSRSSDASEAPTVVSIVPAPDWWIQPASDGGLLLRSPDRVVNVEMTVVAESVAQATLDDVAAGDPLRSEILANGLQVQHVLTTDELFAVLTLHDGVLQVEAQAASESASDLADYRSALGELLESVTEQ